MPDKETYGKCKDCGEHPLAAGRIRCDDCVDKLMAKSIAHFVTTGEMLLFVDDKPKDI